MSHNKLYPYQGIPKGVFFFFLHPRLLVVFFFLDFKCRHLCHPHASVSYYHASRPKAINKVMTSPVELGAGKLKLERGEKNNVRRIFSPQEEQRG